MYEFLIVSDFCDFFGLFLFETQAKNIDSIEKSEKMKKFVELFKKHELKLKFGIYRIFVCLLFVTQYSIAIKAMEIACEKIGEGNWGDPVGEAKICLMHQSTIIDKSDFKILTRDESINALDFNNNKKIEFLPIKVFENFPHLLGYSARGCSIKEVSKKNFENLNKLKVLWLGDNQIEKIPSDAFEDLSALEKVYLCK